MTWLKRFSWELVLVLVMLAVFAAGVCAESAINLKEMSDEQLLSLQSAIQEELAARQETRHGEYDPLQVQITGEYQLAINKSAFYFFVIRNVADYDLELRMEVDALGKEGEVLKTCRTWEHVVSPGAEIVLIPRFVHLPLEEIDHIQFRLASKNSEYYYGVNDQMEITSERIDDGVRITMTNTGITPVTCPTAYVLFFRDGELIDYDGTALFYGNGSNNLDPGMTEEREAHCYKIFDDVKIYTSGEWEG